MNVLAYDGSLEGLLCCIFERYERNLGMVKVVEENRLLLSPFDCIIHVVSNSVKANRVWKGLRKRLSSNALHNFYRCFLSEIEDVGQILTDYALYIFDNPAKKVEKDYGHLTVLKVTQVSKQVEREKHRFEAFVRFKATSDGIYFSIIEPDFNILPLIASHFKKRYADQKWVIYDMKRNFGLYFDLLEVLPVVFKVTDLRAMLSNDDKIINDAEKIFQSLWKSYFKSTNIESRKNSKLHLQHLPKRYWKYLVEKDEAR